MEDVNDLYEDSLDELGALLQADNVVGDPIETEFGTIVPLLSAGFGFGAGGANGDTGSKGAGAGAGGGIKPEAVVVVGPDGVRIERLDDDLWGRLGETAARLVEQQQRQSGGLSLPDEMPGSEGETAQGAD
jgi:uncharacterized spore protein YtfJ